MLNRVGKDECLLVDKTLNYHPMNIVRDWQ